MVAKTAHSLEEVLAAVDKGVTKTGAARVLSCHRMTVDNYCKRWATVADAIADKRRELVDFAELGLRSKVLAGDLGAICFALKTLGKNDGYTERQEISGPDGSPVEVRIREVVVELPGE